jgi:hypothetical protein
MRAQAAVISPTNDRGEMMTVDPSADRVEMTTAAVLQTLGVTTRAVPISGPTTKIVATTLTLTSGAPLLQPKIPMPMLGVPMLRLNRLLTMQEDGEQAPLVASTATATEISI